jgi:hypothetical protein
VADRRLVYKYGEEAKMATIKSGEQSFGQRVPFYEEV